MSQNFVPIVESRFYGMNDKYPSHLLPPGFFQLVENAIVIDNKIVKRPGTDNMAASLGAQNILGLSAYEPNGASKQLIAFSNVSSNAQLYASTGGVYGAIGSANLTKDTQMNFCQASNRLFGFNGVEVVDVDTANTVTRNRATVPTAKFGIWFHNYLFTANTSANPSRLEWSTLGDPTIFTGTDYFDVNPNDGDEITGLSIINDELFVFKKNSIWSITGWSGSTFSATTAAGQNTNSKLFGYGAVSHQSIVSTGRDLFYLSFLGGIPYIRSFQQTLYAETIEQGVVSEDIKNVLDGVNKTQLSKCAGVYDGQFIYWALPNASSLTNDLIIVFDPERRVTTKLGVLRSWVIWTGITPSQYAVSTLSGRAKVYFGDATTGGFVFEQGTSAFEDNGTAVTMDVRTRDYTYRLDRKSKWKYLRIRFNTGFDADLQVKARLEKAIDFSLQDTITTLGLSPGLGPTGSFTLDVSRLGGGAVGGWLVRFGKLVGNLLGIQFLEETANACEILDFEVEGYARAFSDRK